MIMIQELFPNSNRSKRRQDSTYGAGQAVVEFAIVLPVVLLLMVGLINLGVIINAQIILTQAAWEGARAGATLDPFSGEGDAEIEGAVQAAIRGLSDPSVVLITITPDEGSRSVMGWPKPRGEPLEIRLAYPLQLALPIPFNVTLGAEAISRIEYSNLP
jgi:hypothetical protein